MFASLTRSIPRLLLDLWKVNWLSWPVIGWFWFDNTNPKTQDTAHTKTVRKTSQSKDINPKLLRCIRNEMKRNESEIIYK